MALIIHTVIFKLNYKLSNGKFYGYPGGELI